MEYFKKSYKTHAFSHNKYGSSGDDRHELNIFNNFHVQIAQSWGADF